MLKDLLGIYLPLPIQTYGFFLAVTFIVCAYLVSKEMQRKEAGGLMHSSTQKFLKGEPASVTSMIINGAIGFFVGYKLLFGIFNYQSCSSNPQALLLSGEGNILGGILGAAISVFFHYREKQKNKLPKPEWVEEAILPHQHMANIVTIAAVLGIAGAKLFDVIENIDALMKDPLGVILSFSGLAFYGGLICATIGLLVYAKKNKIGILPLCDAAAPALMLGYAIARIGCQLAGDGDWGLPNDAPKPGWMSFLPDWMWSFDYPNNVIHANLKQDFINMGLESITGKAWPTPFYETVMGTILFLFLWSIRKRITTPGILFCVYLIVNGIERFLIETIRINDKYNFLGIELSQAQIIAVSLIAIGVIGMLYLNKNKEKFLQMYQTQS